MSSPRRTDPLLDLLRGLTEPGYADVTGSAGRRRAPSGRSGRPPSRLSVRAAWAARLVVLVLTGILLSIAYQQMVVAKPATTKARADLVTEVRQRQSAADGLQRRADKLRKEVADKRDRAVAGDADVDALRSRAAEAGVRGVTGDGVAVRLADAPAPVDPVTGRQTGDNPGKVLDRDLQDVANALWRLGAEAIAINDRRLTATTTIRAAGGAILVDFRPLTSPYQVVAIGGDDLAGRFGKSATASRFRRYVETYRMGFEIRERDGLRLPAAPEARLHYARPQPSTSSRAEPTAPPSTTPGTSGTPGTSSRSPSVTPNRPSVRSGTGGTS